MACNPNTPCSPVPGCNNCYPLSNFGIPDSAIKNFVKPTIGVLPNGCLYVYDAAVLAGNSPVTEFPVSGTGTQADPITLSPGTNLGDVPYWDPTLNGGSGGYVIGQQSALTSQVKGNISSAFVDPLLGATTLSTSADSAFALTKRGEYVTLSYQAQLTVDTLMSTSGFVLPGGAPSTPLAIGDLSAIFGASNVDAVLPQVDLSGSSPIPVPPGFPPAGLYIFRGYAVHVNVSGSVNGSTQPWVKRTVAVEVYFDRRTSAFNPYTPFVVFRNPSDNNSSDDGEYPLADRINPPLADFIYDIYVNDTTPILTQTQW